VSPEGIVRSCEFGRKYLHIIIGALGKNGILRMYINV